MSASRTEMSEKKREERIVSFKSYFPGRPVRRVTVESKIRWPGSFGYVVNSVNESVTNWQQLQLSWSNV